MSELQPAGTRQCNLFDDPAQETRRHAAMQAMDAINQKWGRGTLRAAAAGRTQGWQMRRERLSPAYTTSWAALPVALAQ